MKLFLIGLALAELISARAIASRSSRNNNDLADDFGDQQIDQNTQFQDEEQFDNNSRRRRRPARQIRRRPNVRRFDDDGFDDGFDDFFDDRFDDDRLDDGFDDDFDDDFDNRFGRRFDNRNYFRDNNRRRVPINNNKQNKDKDLKVRVDTSGQIAIDANRKLDGGLEADVKNNEGQASVKIGSQGGSRNRFDPIALNDPRFGSQNPKSKK